MQTRRGEEKDTRRRILEAALAEFSERGYKSVAINDIAKRLSGISKSTIFYHFGTKMNLAKEVLITFFSQAKEESERVLEKISDPKQRFSKYVDLLVDYSESYPNMVRFVIELFYLASTEKENDEIQEFIKVIMEYFIEFTNIGVQILTECGVKNPLIKMMILMSSVDGMSFYLSSFGQFSSFKKMLNIEELKSDYKEELTRILLEN